MSWWRTVRGADLREFFFAGVIGGVPLRNPSLSVTFSGFSSSPVVVSQRFFRIS
jgi:hypothetical protein